MNNYYKYPILLLLISLFLGCSFDKKTGIWDGDEKRKILAKSGKQKNKNIVKIYSSDEEIYEEEIIATKSIILTKPKKNLFWKSSNLNLQNHTGNLYLGELNNRFLKKKFGKNKFSISKILSSPLTYNDNIILFDDLGTIFKMSLKGKIKWKKNIYKKVYKKIYKNLTFFIFGNQLYVADNIGMIYSMNLDDGNVTWIKNHGIPIKSNIKIFDNKIYFINQENTLVCLDTKDGSKIWDVRTTTSFIKSQNLLGFAISKEGKLVMVNSSGDLLKIDLGSGGIEWSLNPTSFYFAQDTDFFSTTDILINKNEIFYSTSSSTFSINLFNGYVNWEKKIVSKMIPIADGNNVFLVSKNGYFVNLDRVSGEVIWSTNLLKNLKENKRNTEITGFILGNNRIYVTTLSGYLISASANSGKLENFIKIGDNITTSPIISNGALFILTEDSKILGFS